jgi:glycosyltransferase involved in cell wall biosynthesis
MKKRIMIDAYNLALEQGTGVSTYARNLTYNISESNFSVDVLYGISRVPSSSQIMKEISFFDPANIGDFTFFERIVSEIKNSLRSLFRGKLSELNITGEVIYDHYKSRLPYFDRILISPHVYGRASSKFQRFSGFYRLRGGGIDIAHWTYPLPVYLSGAKNIYTMHDLVPLRLPYTTLDKKSRYFRLMRKIAKKSDKIVTVSEASKRDIINILGVKEEDVFNTYQSVSIPDKYRKKKDDVVSEEIYGAFGLSFKKYILYFGAIEPKKNVGRLIEAYLSSNLDTPLVIVGKKAWKSDGELRLIDEEHVKRIIIDDGEIKTNRKIKLLDYVSFPQLVNLIKGAKFITFPSLYEGFGLPVLEGMLCETPVLTSNCGSLPEVAGEAALTIDPYDVRALKDGIIALDSNEDLRNLLVQRGREQVKKFSEEKYQSRLKELYSTI